MRARQRLAVVVGGRSTEHEVSVTSACSIMREADPERFEVIPFGITRGGAWLTPDETRQRLERTPARETGALGDRVGEGVFAYPEAMAELQACDVVFPIVHGTFGEDGTLQGMLEAMDLPYVGSGVTASAVGMDKELARALFEHAGIPQTPYLVLRDAEAASPSNESVHAVEDVLGYPCFVKPCNGGSSVGVSKVRSREDVREAIAEAARHDRKVMVEAAVEGREVECAVLGNAEPEASPVLGQIDPNAEFYTYDAKYIDDTAELIVPARVSDDVRERLRERALAAYQALDCAGLARCDFFVTQDDEIRIIEVNTLPGFTPISMFPRLWQEAGLSYGGLISRLVDLALERYEERRRRA